MKTKTLKRNRENFLKKRKVTAAFAVIALVGGFIFLNRGITGNIILDSRYSFNAVSLIGLLLILCSSVLIAYSIKKR